MITTTDDEPLEVFRNYLPEGHHVCPYVLGIHVEYST